MKLEDIKKVGVVGGGTMGFGIAINFALWGFPTTVQDLNDQVLERTAQRIRKAMQIFVEEGLINLQQADTTIKRISLTTDLAKVANTDFITEAIIERLPDKQELFKKLDGMCPPQTIIVSNTSSLVMSAIARDVKRQNKVALTHYFDPPHIVPGVEVAKGPGTTNETYNITFELMKKVKKIPIRVLKELPGYLLNRIQSAMGQEANRLWAEGVASAEDIELGIKTTFGFRTPHEGPMMHYDLAGIWRWPQEVVIGMRAGQVSGPPQLSPQAAEKIRQRMLEGKPWFVDPARFDEAVERRDREYVRRLKELYWSKEK